MRTAMPKTTCAWWAYAEQPVELTYRRQLNRYIALQPSFQYINNTEGNFTALCARLYYSF